jgi:hypothetical protein
VRKLEFCGFVELSRAPSAQKFVSRYFHKVGKLQSRIRNDELELLDTCFDLVSNLCCEKGELWL